jgi:hypothetical protein
VTRAASPSPILTRSGRNSRRLSLTNHLLTKVHWNSLTCRYGNILQLNAVIAEDQSTLLDIPPGCISLLSPLAARWLRAGFALTLHLGCFSLDCLGHDHG